MTLIAHNCSFDLVDLAVSRTTMFLIAPADFRTTQKPERFGHGPSAIIWLVRKNLARASMFLTDLCMSRLSVLTLLGPSVQQVHN